MDRVRETVAGGWTSNDKIPEGIRVESVTWCVQQISHSRTEMSLAGQREAVNGKVMRCPTIQTLVHHSHQLERYSISDVKPVQLLIEQLHEPKMKRVASEIDLLKIFISSHNGYNIYNNNTTEKLN